MTSIKFSFEIKSKTLQESQYHFQKISKIWLDIIIECVALVIDELNHHQLFYSTVTLNHLAKRHLLACIMITFPFVLTMLLIFILDNFSAAYYSVDYARSSSTYGAMTVMEIRNREDIRPILEKVNPNILTFPAALMMYTSLKYYLFFVLNILSMIVIVPSVWNNLSQTKEAKVNDEKLYILRSSQCINIDRELPIN
ncbi:hypothetical protein ACKWTF_003705 [Chironomus riparius]